MKLVEVDVEHGVFRELEMGRMKELMASPVVVNCKNLFERTDNVVYLGIEKGY